MNGLVELIEIKTLLFFRIGDSYSGFIDDMCVCMLKDPSILFRPMRSTAAAT